MLFSAKSRSYSVPSEDGCEIIVDLLIVIWGIRMKNYRIQSNVTLATWILNKSWRYFAKQYAPHPLSLALFGLLAHARSAPFFLPQSFCNLLPTMCVRVFFSIMFNIFISGIIIIGISIPCKYKRHLLIENSHQYQLHLYDDFYNSPLALHRFMSAVYCITLSKNEWMNIIQLKCCVLLSLLVTVVAIGNNWIRQIRTIVALVSIISSNCHK